MSISLSLITDEVSPVLADGLRLATDEGLAKVDIRSIGGINFMSLDDGAQRAAASEIRDAGLRVGTLATPLLKWPAPGHAAADAGDQFGFDARGRSHAELYDDAIRSADLLGARDLRIFSLLTCDGFTLSLLDDHYDRLLRLAERHDLTLHVENEPVCNVCTVADLVAAMHRWNHPRLRALLDIPNTWRRQRPTEADIAAVAPYVTQLHFKDWSDARNARVAVGDGDIPFRMLLEPIYAEAAHRDITFVAETHMPSAPTEATRRSIRTLKALAV